METLSTANAASQRSANRRITAPADSAPGFTGSAPATRGASPAAVRAARHQAKIEHRQGARQCALALVRVHRGDGCCGVGLLYNRGADGMFVLTEQRPDVNQCVEIELALSPGWDMSVRIKGLVVHRHPSGFGLMFREPDDPALTLLEASLR